MEIEWKDLQDNCTGFVGNHCLNLDRVADSHDYWLYPDCSEENCPLKQEPKTCESCEHWDKPYILE